MPAPVKPQVNTLNWTVPIVDQATGRPTPEFMRAWTQQRNISGQVPYDAASMSALLDLIGKAPGDILYRGPLQWMASAMTGDGTLSSAGALTVTGLQHNPVSGTAPTANQVLTWSGTAWAPSTPITAVIIGAGVPTANEPAGELYSRSDAIELYQSHPASPTLAVVQHKSAIRGSEVPGAITLTGAPVAGNLIVVMLGCNVLISGVTLNTSGWTKFCDANFGSNTFYSGMGLYRYAQPGDTAALPALWTAGTTYWAYDVYEISGVAGTFATDELGSSAVSSVQSVNVGALTTGTINTTMAGALALVGGFQYNGSADPSLSVGWTQDEVGHNNSNYGSVIGGSQVGVASGTALSATVTYNHSDNPAAAILLVLQPSAALAHWDKLYPVANEIISMTAAVALSGHRAVYVNSSGSAAVPAIVTLANGVAIIGITTGAASMGAAVAVQTEGQMTEPSWAWTPGLPVYIADGGVLTQVLTSGKWVRQIAIALSATSIDIALQVVISTP